MRRRLSLAALLLALALPPGAASAAAFARGDTIRAETPAETQARHELEADQRWRRKNKPFIYPDGRRWATPYPIAWCESGGDYFASPWGAYGLTAFEPFMPPKRQDEVAHRLYLEQGEAPWAPYETACIYR